MWLAERGGRSKEELRKPAYRVSSLSVAGTRRCPIRLLLTIALPLGVFVCPSSPPGCLPPFTQLLDARAGAWDLRFGERLVKLGLWCCMHNADQRPSMPTLRGELERLASLLHSQGQL